MSFPRYPKYKASGVEWLGEVPEHWEVKRLRHVSKVRKGRLPEGTSTVQSAETDLPYLSMEFLRGEAESTAFVAESANLIRAEDKDTLLLWDGSNAGEFLRAKRGVVSSTVALIEPEGVTKDYLFFACKACERRLKDQTVGMGIPHVSGDELRSTAIPLPPLPEQTTIANFLDRETGKIDALVAEQRRLMELLKEKRQAVISHAVTKGLNPNAPLKDTGIDWLGPVPAHWEVPSLGVLILKAELGENHDSSEGNEGVPVMKMGNLDRGFIKLDKVEYLPEGTEVNESVILRDGDFLFNTRNSLDLVGKVAIWRGELPRATYNSNVLRISFNPLKVASREFMNYLFNSDFGLSQLRALAKGTTSVAAIYYKDLTSLRVMLPPGIEQHAIAKHLDAACTQFELLTAEAQRAIDLLQERRTAIISAAVTGHIDVRAIASLS